MNYQYNLGIAFQNVAEKNASKHALRYPEGETYDYAWLDHMSNQIAGFLSEKNILKGEVVAIFNEKSVYAFSLMLACLKTGIIYTNLDVSSPWPRIEKIIKNSQPKAVFFDQETPDIQHFFPELLPCIQSYNLTDKDLQTQFSTYSKEKWPG